jgi:hypothetical protein
MDGGTLLSDSEYSGRFVAMICAIIPPMERGRGKHVRDS